MSQQHNKSHYQLAFITETTFHNIFEHEKNWSAEIYVIWKMWGGKNRGEFIDGILGQEHNLSCT